MTKEENLAHVHEVLFDMLKEIFAVCEKHGVRVYIEAGTLLGAVRHKDFIPWDDDADLIIRREDYPKFFEAAKNLPAKYQLVLPNDYGGYFFDFVPRVIALDEPLRPDTEEDLAQKCHQNRVAIDLFAMDTYPDGALARKLYVLRSKILYAYGMAHRYNKHLHEHSFIQKISIFIGGLVGRCLSLDTILKKESRHCGKYLGKKTKMRILSNGLIPRMPNAFPAEAHEETVMLPIRDGLFPAPKGWHDILTCYYGDYMTPPKEAERLSLHINDDEK